MTISTRRQYGLEVIIESGSAKIVEVVSTSVFDKEKKNGLGLPLKIGDKVDSQFKGDVRSLLEDIYYIESVSLGELMAEWYNSFSGWEKDEFLEKIGIKQPEI